MPEKSPFLARRFPTPVLFLDIHTAFCGGVAGGTDRRNEGREKTPQADKPVVQEMETSTEDSESEERGSVKDDQDSEENGSSSPKESESGTSERRKSSLSVRTLH